MLADVGRFSGRKCHLTVHVKQQQCLVAKATIDEVSQASPAEAAGLRVGDQVCRFGPVSIQDCPSIHAKGDMDPTRTMKKSIRVSNPGHVGHW